ncbi:hypothetical protein KKA14_19700 [bacterium]|nr:hypothetical protein [bacterium]
MTTIPENTNSGSWQVTKEKLVREVNGTYEAIRNFTKHDEKSNEELEAMNMDDLSAYLITQTELLNKLVSEWNVG